MRGDPSDFEPDIDPQGLWQSQQKEYDAMTLVAIHDKAAAFEKQINRRNAVEYMTYGITIGITAAVMFFPRTNLVMRAGCICQILSMLFIAWQLNRRATPEATPPAGVSLIEAYRRQLIRQRDAGRTGLWWYVLPLVPGPALILAGLWIRGPAAGKPVLSPYIPTLIMGAVMAACLGFVVYCIRANVRRLQRKIDEL